VLSISSDEEIVALKKWIRYCLKDNLGTSNELQWPEPARTQARVLPFPCNDRMRSYRWYCHGAFVCSEIALFFLKTAVICFGDVWLSRIPSLPVEPTGRRSEVSVEFRPQIIWVPRYKWALSRLFPSAIFPTSSSSALGRPIEEFAESGNLSVPPVALPSATANELPEPARRQRENLA
jgi:hypothetical protein